MDFCFTAFAALLLLIAAASCAPAGLSVPDACEDVRSSSLAFNRIARLLSTEALQARNGTTYLDDFPSPAWMEVKDTCGPEALRQTSVPCVEKMLRVLRSYGSAVERLSGLECCSKFTGKVKPALQKLHRDMSKCAGSRPARAHRKFSSRPTDEVRPNERYEDDLRCYYTLDRLYSFSIVAARVFAVGDPAHHADGSAQRCAQRRTRVTG